MLSLSLSLSVCVCVCGIAIHNFTLYNKVLVLSRYKTLETSLDDRIGSDWAGLDKMGLYTDREIWTVNMDLDPGHEVGIGGRGRIRSFYTYLSIRTKKSKMVFR